MEEAEHMPVPDLKKGNHADPGLPGSSLSFDDAHVSTGFEDHFQIF